MATYEFQYSLGAPEKRTNGSGCVKHPLKAEAKKEGTEEWVAIRSKDIVFPGDIAIAALTTGTLANKIAAYKALIVEYFDYTDEAVNGWEVANLQMFLDGNELAALAETAIKNFVETELPVTKRVFPISFQM